jgi:hypothetical protein
MKPFSIIIKISPNFLYITKHQISLRLIYKNFAIIPLIPNPNLGQQLEKLMTKEKNLFLHLSFL